ncbi:hypothetical protein [Paenibacillus macquariensis]|uniref:Fibronectin type-III domain-containing protein n=1 Tax=Paenibacillus macquariensis TaxID=948756 RepID=A0ABY1JNP5_9BACL|nr:hypothetical protein [Paenibacillus macquariensis]MEC0092135.1 hypothetical protein [Paenibacillus macquariensis]OAB37307.1 hypothetical protein PMSM_04350 [Paenibacillus macquariensis subsp. macquariensis]SIQ50481.1 hypothetical protein SAMN05421578_102296 [Paenibacillus macquariensis]
MLLVKNRSKHSVFRILVVCFLLMFSIIPIASAAAPDPITNLQITSTYPVTLEWTNPTTDYDYIQVIKLNRTDLKEVYKKTLTKGSTVFADHSAMSSNKEYWYIFQAYKGGVSSNQVKKIYNN